MFFFSRKLMLLTFFTTCFSPWARRGHHVPPSATSTCGIILFRGPSWLRIKMLTLDTVWDQPPHFGRFSKWPPRKLRKVIYGAISACYHLICLPLGAKHQYLRTWNSFLIYKAETHVFKCYHTSKMAAILKHNFLKFSSNFQLTSWFFSK